VDAFWSMIDEILNAVLFLLIGLEFLAVRTEPTILVAGLLVAGTYAVVIFSILVQGLTVRRVLAYYGVGEAPAA
jgi:CPA1 family monovalent cation:H+ antiporter